MTRRDLADQLLAAAEIADELPRGELQVLLRRAALLLRNDTRLAVAIYLDDDLIDVFDKIAAEAGVSLYTRNDVLNTVLRDWAIRHGHIRG